MTLLSLIVYFILIILSIFIGYSLGINKYKDFELFIQNSLQQANAYNEQLNKEKEGKENV